MVSTIREKIAGEYVSIEYIGIKKSTWKLPFVLMNKIGQAHLIIILIKKQMVLHCYK